MSHRPGSHRHVPVLLLSTLLPMPFAACGGGGGGGGPPAAVAPTLLIQQPASDITVSVGGYLEMSLVAQDPDSQAPVVLLADGDGDVATVADQFLLEHQFTGPLLSTTAAVTQRPLIHWLDTAGSFSILGVIDDPVHGPVVAAAPGRVTVANVGYAQHVGGPLDDFAGAVGVAADGSYVVTGAFRATATFGIAPTSTTLTMTNHDPNMFVARYAADGRVLWAKKCDSFDSHGQRIAVAADGSCVVLGDYTGTPGFPASVGEGSRLVTLPNASFCAFLCRYDPDGQLVYALPLSQQGNVSLGRVAIAADGSCVVVGSFTGTMVIGGGTNQAILEEVDGRGFIVRFAADGAILSTAQLPVQLAALVLFEDGGMAVSGTFSGTATITLGTAPRTVTATGGVDMLLLRFASNGELLHLNQAGGTHHDCRVSPGAIFDRSGLLYVVGNLNMAATFGAQTLSPTHNNVFVATYLDDTGSADNAFLEGGSTNVGVADATTLRDGRFVVTGTYGGTATFGSQSGQPIQRTAAGLFDPYILCMADDGQLLWVATPEGLGQDAAHAITALPDGSCVVVGHGEDGLSFGAAGTVAMPIGYPSGYLARVNANGQF